MLTPEQQEVIDRFTKVANTPGFRSHPKYKKAIKTLIEEWEKENKEKENEVE